MNTLSIDIETFSSEDLSRAGVYRYAEAPDFRVLLFGYRIDDAPVKVCKIAAGEEPPEEVLTALTDGRVIKWAFNAAFERICLSRYLRDRGRLKEGEYLNPKGWRCSMVWCAYMGLPLSLAKAGEALRLECQKMAEGKRLIRCFSVPEGGDFSAQPSASVEMTKRETARKAAQAKRETTGKAALDEKWQQFIEYNRRDVEAECAIKERLKHYPVPEFIWEQYELDQEINDRGIRIDRELVAGAVKLDGESRAELTGKLKELTGLGNPNSVTQIREWLEDRGTEVPDLSRKQVSELLKTASDETRPVLLLRQQLARSSVKKYQAMENSVCADGRIRGLFQFYGASRSGRWAGRGVQLQNLPQNHMEDGILRQLRETVRQGVHPRAAGGNEPAEEKSIPDVLSELIRTAFVPEEGKKFIVADFSAIEARVIAWLAGETWRSEVFAAGGDIYCASAEKMFGVPVEKHGINSHLRQKGKVAELALGYGGGVGALKAMGALEAGIPEGELQGIVNAWRAASPRITGLWRKVDGAVKEAIRRGEASTATGRTAGEIRFTCRSDMLFIRLPSGRCLSYAKPRITENCFGNESVNYLGLGPSRKWERIESYGPKFTENIVQGIARDLLAEAMVRIEVVPRFRIVAHIHDEVIIEAEPEDSAEEVCRIMSEVPEWATGLLLKADGYECKFYQKV